MCLVAKEITYLAPNRPPRLITPDCIPRFPFTRKNVIIPYVVNHLCNLYGAHWYRLQCIASWPFWLWVMAVTWLYLPLTFSRLGLRNLGMGSWVRTLKVCKVFAKVGQGPWRERRLCLGPTDVIAPHNPRCPSEWVCFLEHLAITKTVVTGQRDHI